MRATAQSHRVGQDVAYQLQVPTGKGTRTTEVHRMGGERWGGDSVQWRSGSGSIGGLCPHCKSGRRYEWREVMFNQVSFEIPEVHIDQVSQSQLEELAGSACRHHTIQRHRLDRHHGGYDGRKYQSTSRPQHVRPQASGYRSCRARHPGVGITRFESAGVYRELGEQDGGDGCMAIGFKGRTRPWGGLVRCKQLLRLRSHPQGR